jgi:hypothetical protein
VISFCWNGFVFSLSLPTHDWRLFSVRCFAMT